MAYRVYHAGNCQGCGVDLGVIEQNGGRDRKFCSDRCKQAAYRRKRKGDKRNGGLLRKEIERELDMSLHLLACGCGRGIWTVRGNVTIGHVRCTLCDTEFV